jgi:hypothetical protein
MAGGILEIGQVDIYDSVELLEYVQTLPSARIVYEREPETFGCCYIERKDNMRRVMGRCNNIDVMASPSLEDEHDLCQILNAPGSPLSFQADFMVYAKDTSKPTMREKDRP